jgi:hypothetical protein
MRAVVWRVLVASAALQLAAGIATLASAQAGSPHTLRGVVRDSATGETLARASVTIEGTTIGAQSNTDGRFVLPGVPSGAQTLVVRYIGYNPARFSLNGAADTTTLVVKLVQAQIRLSDVVVIGQRSQGVDAGQRVSEITVSPEQVATTPSVGEKDIFRTLQLLPGVSNANKGNSGLYIRGGTPDQNLVLFDGMTMYHVDHFFGIFSAFNVDAIKDIRLYAGGYPAKFGGRVSSVVDLTGKSGDEHNMRASAGLSLLSGRAVVEVPLGRGSLLLSGRRSYTDVLRSGLYNKLFQSTGATTTQQAPGGGGFGGGGRGGFTAQTLQPSFYFSDENAKLSYRPSSRDLVSVSLYGGTDNLDQSNTASVTFRGGPGGAFDGGTGIGDGDTGQIKNTDVSQWGNHGGSARWFRQWIPRFSSDVLAATSTYHSDADRSSTATLAASTGRTGTLARPSFNERNTVNDLTFRVDNEFEVAQSLNVDFGAWLSKNRVRYAFSQLQSDTAVGGLSRNADGTQASLYAQGVWSPVARVAVTGGVRSTAYSLTSRTYLEPRLQGTVRLNSVVQLKGAWGRYHQFVNRVENEDILNGSRDFWLLADTSLLPTASEHRILGVTFDMPDYLLSIEAYDKTLDNLALFSRRFRRVSFAADYNTLFYSGTGRARGLDVLAQKKFGALTGWLSYSLGKVTERFADVDADAEFPASQDQRHELKAVGTYQVRRWTLSSAFVFGSGTPYTSPESQYYLGLLDGTQVGYVHVGDKNAARLPAYHRLDLAVFRRIRLNDRLDWEFGASVFNVYDRKNVAYRRFDLSTAPITITDAYTLGRTPSIDVRLILK